jgi:hypothetical protein
MAQASLARVADLAEEDGGMRNPLNGMFPPDLPVPTTLAAAVAAVMATLDTASSDMQRRTACPGPEPAVVLPARHPADQRDRLRPPGALEAM